MEAEKDERPISHNKVVNGQIMIRFQEILKLGRKNIQEH